jgi:hypothetical protein
MKNKRDNDASTYMCLFIENMKPNISNNESKDMLNEIMGCNVFPYGHTRENVFPLVYKLVKNAMNHVRSCWM